MVLLLTALAPSAIGAAPASEPIRVDGPVSRTWLGGFLRSAGDVNHDGRDDIIVGRHSGEGGEFAPAGSTAAVVIFGSTSLASFSVADMTATSGFRIWPSGESDGSGDVVDGIGDVDGDGFGDVIVTSNWAAANDRPVAHVLLGSANPSDVDLANVSADQGWSITAPADAGALIAAAGAGDVNGDGFSDVMVAFNASPHGRDGAGSVFLIYGAADHAGVDLSALPAGRFIRIDGSATYYGLGAALAAGDVNGDGRPDLIIRRSQEVGAALGAIVIVWGRASLADIDLADPPTGWVTVVPAPPMLGFGGDATLAAGDVNGDGRTDVVVGDPRYQKSADPYSRHGSVLVMLGGTSFPAAAWRIVGGTYNAQLGAWVAARDMDGDGRAEIASTAFLDVVPGVAFVVRGRSATSDIDLSVVDPNAWWQVVAPATADRAGQGVGIADVTGDHVADLLVSDPQALAYTGSLLISPTVDGVAPIATTPSRSFVAGSALTSGRVTVRLAWTGRDAQSGIDHYDVSQSTDWGSWSTIAHPLAPRMDRALSGGHVYRFRVRAIDRAGNVGTWAYGSTFRVTALQQWSSAIRYRGIWSTNANPAYWGGTTARSTMTGATASVTFTGRSIAWVGLKAANRGKAQVYVNGVLRATVDLYSATTKKQVVLWTATYGSSSTRTLTIKVLGTPGRPLVDVDGLFVGS